MQSPVGWRHGNQYWYQFRLLVWTHTCTHTKENLDPCTKEIKINQKQIVELPLFSTSFWVKDMGCDIFFCFFVVVLLVHSEVLPNTIPIRLIIISECFWWKQKLMLNMWCCEYIGYCVPQNRFSSYWWFHQAHRIHLKKKDVVKEICNDVAFKGPSSFCVRSFPQLARLGRLITASAS